ncbi:MAG: alpha-glucan family phosphorylase, partial [Candidatus Eisenbacteria bacterium]|nr:alpha-glucan family phosphorylase [Candidatus Eisenbacteria bacterium]
MPKTQVLHIKPRLPENLEGLRTLAMNLRWTWDFRTAELFEFLDPKLWARVRHNPVVLLGSMDQRRLEKLASDRNFLKRLKEAETRLQDYLGDETWFQRTYPQSTSAKFAYFSAEFGIHECVPFYSGGLGVLAGDHLKSASDLGVPLVGVGLAYHQGYFRQYLNADGWQQEAYLDRDFYNLPMTLVKDEHGQPLKVEVEFPEKNIVCYIWKLAVGRIELFLLDTNVPENDISDRPITRRLYGGNKETRIRQEMILGIGGFRALKAMGIEPTVCHMNEGHAAFLGMERVRQTRKDLGLEYEAAQQMTSA